MKAENNKLEIDGKNKEKGFGVQVVKTWYWCDSWLEIVRKHCRESAERYKKNT